MNNANMNNTIYAKRKRFLQRRCNYNLNSLESYYNIDKSKFKISLAPFDETNDKLEIKYEYIYPNDVNEIKTILKNNILRCNNVYLPSEINRIIVNHIQDRDFISININIECPENYPFESLKWSLINTRTNIGSLKFTPKQLDDYFKFQVEEYNKLLTRNTSVILHVDKEIIMFISGIYTAFDYFIQ